MIPDHRKTREDSPAAIEFLGGVGTVTGSKHLVSSARDRVLVDCGLFQGLASLRRRNWARLPVGIADLDAVLLTHAHLDHTGYLPVLVRAGWRGPVYATPDTARLAEIVLLDSAHLMEEEAAHANARGWSKHHPARPLYTRRDAAAAVACVATVDFDTPFAATDGVAAEFGSAGHILGSAWVRLDLAGGRTVVVSGDLGRTGHPLLNPPRPRPDCDALLLESTYGARVHDDADLDDRLARTITDTVGGGGSVLIPAFAVDRTEVVLAALSRLRRAEAIPDVPVLVDSPMALASLRVYQHAIAEHDPRLRPALWLGGDPFAPLRLYELHTVEESMEANRPRLPSVVISASGMATGGRVLHHLKHLLPDRRNTVVIVGFAAAGTRARQLADGAGEVKIHGRYVRVRARVDVLDGFSAHADADDLVTWATSGRPPRTAYLVHGEPDASASLAGRLRDEHGWSAVLPREGERVLV
ncbi:MBL fold metallo-hydrolase RNA specificity domain-containing protein [Actinokineospora guangxiensis]|uniref:MBL fold metallo-hydrolase RNA specificity domain-containing protein n=1 Tax=Actinokineospora guangxiensis TaxID=1490288 RepID=A0ABW0EY90_9PSEU